MAQATWNEVLITLLLSLIGVLGTTITLMAPFLVRKLMAYIDTKRGAAASEQEIEEREARQKRIEQIVSDAVATTTQTFTEALKEGAADHKLTEADRKEAMAKTMTTIRKHLITERIPAMSELLEDYVEAEIARLKMAK